MPARLIPEHPSAVARVAKVIGLFAASALLPVTLMACYGLPPCDPDDDRDRDGAYSDYCADYDRNGPTLRDCNDEDPTIHECAPDELGDGIDQNCDGVDGKAVTTSTTYDPCVTQ